MSLLVAIILGLVQGLTEFIPVSSSGHLVILGDVLNIENKFVFDVLLNIGTLAALTWYCRRQILEIIKQISKGDWTLTSKIIIATLPAVVVGYFGSEFFESLNTNTLLVAIMLIIVGLLMLGARQCRSPLKRLHQISLPLALAIGSAQAIALIPGTSRSGITILAGLWLGLSRKLSAEWSFLLAIPVIAGATSRTLFSSQGMELVARNFGAVVVGNIASFIAAMIAIDILLKILKRHSLRGFGVYRIGLGLLLITLISVNIL